VELLESAGLSLEDEPVQYSWMIKIKRETG